MTSQLFIEFWREISRQMIINNTPLEIIEDAHSDDIYMEEVKGVHYLHCSLRLCEYLERHLDIFKPIYRRYLDKGRGVKLQYITTD